ncbi:MAG: NAD(P)/FAD-dependent oxidoreductase [Lewinellaceae bacterium]|nr:NAD(P)/FAD-dependent oxidoreductase [Lewinellaceae bacterium]
MKKSAYPVVIIGAGTAGVTVAAQLKRKDRNLEVAIIDPADTHYYQPAWTLVAAGTFNYAKTARPMSSVIPKGVDWIKEKVADIQPDQNQVILENGDKITYEYLVAAPGIKIDPALIPGLAETMDKNGVCSIYTNPKKVWENLQAFKGGNALFTQPATPIKCGGAPQKIMYLSDDYFRRTGVRDKTNIIFATPGTIIFGTPEFAKTLMEVVDRKHIQLRFFHQLIRVDGPNKKAYYKITANADNPAKLYHNEFDFGQKLITETEVEIPFDLMHLAPPQAAPDFFRKTKLANQAGWANVDIHTLQHKEYANVFALGDVADLPTAKTGAAVRKQAPVVVENISRLRASQKQMTDAYTGYSSCPLVTGYGKMLLAEFGYDNIRMSDPMISRFVDTTKEQYSMWILKKYGLPFMYWNLMLKGLA